MTAPVRPYRPDNPFAQQGEGSKPYRPENPFAPQQEANEAPKANRPSWLGTQARATVAGVGGAGLRTAGRVARALDAVTPERLRSNMGDRFEQMATGLEDRLAPEDPQRAAEFRSGTAGAGLALELAKYMATGRWAAALAPGSPVLAGAMGAMGLGAVEDVGSRPEESVAAMLAQGANLAGADRTATFLNEQAQSPVGRTTVGALLGLVPEAAIRAPGMVRSAARSRAARGATPGAPYVPPAAPEGQKLLPAGQYEMPAVREPITDPARLLPEAGTTPPRPTVQYDGPAGPGIPALSPEGRLAREMEAIAATPDDVARYRTARDGGRVPSPTGQTVRRPGAALADALTEADASNLRNRPGTVNPEVLGTVGGAAVGGAVGGAVDPETDRGIIGGAIAGATAGRLGSRALTRAAKASNKASTPALSKVRATINAGDRKAVEAPQWLSPTERLYTDLISETFPLVKAAGDAGGTSGKQRMLGAIARLHGHQRAAQQYLEDTLGPSFRAATDRVDDVRALTKARRDLDIRTKGGAAKSDLTDADLRQAIADGEANPVVKQAADDLTALHRDLLRMRHEAGLLDDAAYKAIVESEDFYTPFVREFAEEASTTIRGAKTGKLSVGSSGVAKMDRTMEAIAQTADPFEVAAAAVQRTYRDVGKQRVQNILTEFADAGQLPIVRRVTGDPPKHGRVYSQMVDGQKVQYEVVDKDVFDAIAGMDAKSTNLVVRMAQAFTRIGRTGITMMPDFAVANFIRDAGQSGPQRMDWGRGMREAGLGAGVGGTVSAATADEGEDKARAFIRGMGYGAGAGALARPFARSMEAMGHIIGDTETYKDFLRRGGSTEGFNVRTPKDAREALRVLKKDGLELEDIVSPRRWVDALQWIGSVGEQSTRLAKDLEAGRRGMDDATRAYLAQDVSLRFRNVGRATKGIASVTKFWNAKVQGWDKLARMVKDPKTSAMAATMITAPTLALWDVNKDNPHYWERPQFERNLFWLIPKEPGGSAFWRIPKPFELGYLFASLPERALDYAAQNGLIESAAPKTADPARALARSVGDMAGSTFEGSVPIPDALALGLQVKTGRDWFRNRDIVSRKQLPTEMQVGERTSAVARQFGKVGISPEKADFVLGDIAGTAGRQALGGMDAIARRLGIDAPEKSVEDNKVPVIPQRFQTREYAVTESERTARDRLDRLDTVYQGLQALQASGKADEARAYREANTAALRERAALNDARLALNRVRDERGQVLRNPRLSEDQKAERLKQLRARALVISRRIQSYEAK